MIKARAISSLTLIVLGGLAATAGSAQIKKPDIGINRVPLACRIQDEKVIVITNTSGGPLAAGTQIGYDAIRKPDRQHYGRTIVTGLVPAGASIQDGGRASFSCTAWFIKQLVLSPQ